VVNDIDRRTLGAGAVVMRGSAAELFQVLDSAFSNLAAQFDAEPMLVAGLLGADLLTRIDYFRNFPHLGLGTYEFSADSCERLGEAAVVSDVLKESTAVVPSSDFLPSATCYSIYGALAGQNLPEHAFFTGVGRCFRNETGYEGLRRLHSFTMREIVYVGDTNGAEAFRARVREWLLAYAGAWGVDLRVEVASDPFFQQHSRAVLTQLDPVKWEYVADDGTAIASTNKHRNFFGERLDITVAGQTAVSSCAAFGLERWLHTLIRRYGSARAALQRQPVHQP
jgi:hypothetical protein